MKMTNEFSEVKVSQAAKKFEFTNSPVLFNILSDSLYSNKIGSIVRELASNARDAHRAVGKLHEPFKISLTSKSLFYYGQPCFSIKDNGPGLTEEEVMNIYSVYGASNKRDSNEFTGGFGIGSKSPFSYTESFTVISIVDGVKNTYCAFIDKDGFPSITKMGTSETEEGNGLEVCFAIKTSDIANFRYEIKNQLNAFYPRPDVTNASIGEWRSEVILEETSDWILLSESSATNFYVDIDCVRYAVKSEMLKNAVPLNWGSAVVFKINVGDVDISASRESLAYTKKTISFLEGKMDKLAEDFSDLIQKAFLLEPSLWDACYKVRNVYPLVNLLRDPFKRMDASISDAFKKIEKEVSLTEIQDFEPFLYFFSRKGKLKKITGSTATLYRVEYDYKNKSHKAILNIGGYKVYLVSKRTTVKAIQEVIDRGIIGDGIIIKCVDTSIIKNLLNFIGNPTVVNINDEIKEPEKVVTVKKERLYSVSIKENSRRSYIYRPFNSCYLCNWNLSGTRHMMPLSEIIAMANGPEKDSIIFLRTLGSAITTYDKGTETPDDNSPEVKKLIRYLHLVLEIYNNTENQLSKIVFLNSETWKALNASPNFHISYETEFAKLKKMLFNFKQTHTSNGVNVIAHAKGFAKVPNDVLDVVERISNNVGASEHHNLGSGKFQDLIKEYYYKSSNVKFNLIKTINGMAEDFGIDTTKDPYYDNFIAKNPFLRLIMGDVDEKIYAQCVKTYIND